MSREDTEEVRLHQERLVPTGRPVHVVVPASLEEVQPAVQELFERATQTPFSELEGRIRWQGESQVPLEFFKQLLGRCEKSKTWSQVLDWQDSADFLFEDQLRCTRAVDMTCTWLTKSTKQVLDMNLLFASPSPSEEEQEKPAAAAQHGAPPLSLRMSLKTEVPIAGSPPLAKPHLVRIKRRKVFVYKDLWEYCFTLVWSGKTHALAYAQKQPRCEIEIEWRKPKNAASSVNLAAVQTTAVPTVNPDRRLPPTQPQAREEAPPTVCPPMRGLDYKYLSTSILLKLIDLLPPPSVTKVVLAEGSREEKPIV